MYSSEIFQPTCRVHSKHCAAEDAPGRYLAVRTMFAAGWVGYAIDTTAEVQTRVYCWTCGQCADPGQVRRSARHRQTRACHVAVLGPAASGIGPVAGPAACRRRGAVGASVVFRFGYHLSRHRTARVLTGNGLQQPHSSSGSRSSSQKRDSLYSRCC